MRTQEKLLLGSFSFLFAGISKKSAGKPKTGVNKNMI